MFRTYGRIELLVVDNDTGKILERVVDTNTAVWLKRVFQWMMYEGRKIDEVLAAMFRKNAENYDQPPIQFTSGQNIIQTTGGDDVIEMNVFGTYNTSSQENVPNWSFWAGCRKIGYKRGFLITGATVAGQSVDVDYSGVDAVQRVNIDRSNDFNGNIYLIGHAETTVDNETYVLVDEPAGQNVVFSFAGNEYSAVGSGLAIYAFKSGVENPEWAGINPFSGQDIINPYPVSVTDINGGDASNQYAIGWEPLALYSGPSVSVDSENKVITGEITLIGKMSQVGARQVQDSGYDTQPVWMSGQVMLDTLVIAPTVWLKADEVIKTSSATTPSGEYTQAYVTYAEMDSYTQLPIFPVALAKYKPGLQVNFDVVSLYVRWTIGFQFSYA